MPYTLKPDNNVICQCGAIINKYYVQKHLQTAKHKREMQGSIYIHAYVHRYLYVYRPFADSAVQSGAHWSGRCSGSTRARGPAPPPQLLAQ